MTYSISRSDLASITDLEAAFGTERFLPALADIPDEFKSGPGNIYTRVANAIFYNTELPAAEMHFRPGFQDDAAPGDLNKCVRAHLRSFGPEHDHKLAGVAYLIALVSDVTPAAATG